MRYPHESSVPVDFNTQLSLGQVPGMEVALIGGSSKELDQNVEHDLWNGDVDELIYITSAETMNVASTDAADTLLGTGGRTLFISGLDDNYERITEVVEMNGITNKLTVNSYLRINFMFLLSSGTDLQNIGQITVTSSSTGFMQETMEPEEGISRSGHYTVPAGHTLLIKRFVIGAAKIASGMTPKILFKTKVRFEANGNPWIIVNQGLIDTAITNMIPLDQEISAQVFAKADVRFTGTSDTANGALGARATGILVDNNILV